MDHDEAREYAVAIRDIGIHDVCPVSAAQELARAYLDLHAATHGIGKRFLDDMRQTNADLREAVKRLESNDAEIEALRRVREAAKRCYPTLIGHMIHCAALGRSDCDCGKYENDKALGEALTATRTGGGDE